MNRTDRLFALLLHLQGQERTGGWVNAEVLARQFGVSVRTIYRDVLALNESGVPVVSLPGKGYRLLEGYVLPPLHLSVPEAVMLALGADAVRRAFDTDFREAATQALQKIEAALPEARRQEVQEVRAHLRVVPPAEGENAAKLRPLRSAVLGHRVVQFQYHKPQANPERREVYPLGLVHLYGVWLLAAFDPQRGEQRVFRLSRIEGLEVQARSFERHPDWKVGPTGTERRDVAVRLHFAGHLRRAVQERPSFYQAKLQDVPEGFEVLLQVRDLHDILPWVLSWGAGVRVLEPPELTERVRAEAREMLLT